ncbi:ATP-binding protein [Anatilimnocola floriformis]|uniref:ATP-binding protein n=1 Tax=Anatilimnocola floriformis TaxID=2948575 RepID=UPI0020C2B3CD|nr:ATP-binding protein [Anatilimnocola floriformis]
MNSFVPDLTNCDREPIHQPGAIQPHGALLVCDAETLIVTHASDNLERLCGIPAQAAIGQGIGTLFPVSQVSGREMTLRQEVREGRPVYMFSVRIKGVSRPFDGIAHRSGNSLFFELEPGDSEKGPSAPELYRLVQRAVTRFQQSASVLDICQTCVRHIRRITGFDRVMAYRFDEEWNGQVIAEEKRDDLESFLGLHYPASDIPRQARELYTKNWLRFIADRDYVPSKIIPEVHAFSPQPLDMSYCVLRSVSPIHLEYLRNMGVGASMSVSLMREGKLWGLIACHHYSERYVPYDVRTACEMLGQWLSMSLTAAEDRETRDYREASRIALASMMTNIEREDDLAFGLIEQTPNLLSYLKADGAAFVMGDRVFRLGQTPGEAQILQLADWIGLNVQERLVVTDCLQNSFGSALFGSVASGVLAIQLTTSPRQQLIWFRTEQIHTVDWAGDPQKTVAKGEGEPRLSPRGSFALWKETIRGRSTPWLPEEREAAQHLRDALLAQLVRRTETLISAHSDLRLASEEREKTLDSERLARLESERLHRMKDEFVATLSHELRTPLNAILGWSQLLKREPELRGHVSEGLDVIERNARAQAKIVEDLLDISRIISGKVRLDLQDTNIPSIVEGAISTMALAADSKGVRIEKIIDPLRGVQTTGDPQRLQQIVWNLLSNAVKFTPRGGKVQVILERVSSHVELTIADSGQGIDPAFLPYVFDRFRQAESASNRKHGGLGLGLSIVRNLVELHGGAVRASSRGNGQGATFVVSLPVRAIQQPEGEDPTSSLPHPLDCESFNLQGVRVFVVDDEVDSRELVGRILTECECVVNLAGSADEALQILARESADVIISDIGMPGRDGYEFLKAWRAREQQLQLNKIPAVALTAYARAEDRRRALVAGFQAHVAKPVDRGELLAIVASLTGRV